MFDTGIKGNTIEHNKYTISKHNKNQSITPRDKLEHTDKLNNKRTGI